MSHNRQKTDFERFYLWWECPKTSQRDIAGVAYYNESNGDYRVVINFLPDNNYFLKSIGGPSDEWRYRLLSVKAKGGKTSRFIQGEGVLNQEKNEVVIRLYPFVKPLILSFNSLDSCSERINASSCHHGDEKGHSVSLLKGRVGA